LITPSKAYVVVDSNLSAGAKIAQSCHALVELVRHEPEMAQLWNEGPNVLIVLEADHGTLYSKFVELIPSAGVHEFCEPDFHGKMTAFGVFNEGAHVNVPLSELSLSRSKNFVAEWKARRRENKMRGHLPGTESSTHIGSR